MTIEWNLILRMLVGGLLGGLIGLQREFRAKEAGVRTHFLVALGSALFMLVSQYGFDTPVDSSRVASQVVSGIGFIGAGVIIFQKNVVRGVTTAAGIWVAGAVGLACGGGMYVVATAATLFTILCLEAMHFVTKGVSEVVLNVTLQGVGNEDCASLIEQLKGTGLELKSISASDGNTVLQILTKKKEKSESVRRILSLTEGHNVEIV